MSFIVQELIIETVGASSCSLLIPSASEVNSTRETFDEYSLDEKMNDGGQNGDSNPGQSASKTHVLPIIPRGSSGLVFPSLQKVVLASKQAVYLVPSLSKQAGSCLVTSYEVLCVSLHNSGSYFHL